MKPAQDTIVAAASPPGRSPRGLLRISGPQTRAIIEALTDRCVDGPPDASHLPIKVLARCRLILSDHTGEHADSTLPALAMFVPGPGSYTGQDVAEIQCPGNPALLGRLIRATCQLGARMAEPGEFTFRAFLAGKMDLTQAEGVAATIAASSDGQLQAASLLRTGALGQFATRMVHALARQLALIEAGIDFVDQEDVVPIGPAQLEDNLAPIEADLAKLTDHSRSWGALEALPHAVLVGAPSTGKSTLFNALLGRHRAVMAPMPGTTRDILTEPIRIESADGRRAEAMIVDMAGVNEPQSLLDAAIQTAVQREIASADVILHIRDGRDNGVEDPPETLAETRECPDSRGQSRVSRASEPQWQGEARAEAQRMDHRERVAAIETGWPNSLVIEVRNKADLGIGQNESFDVAVSATTGAGLKTLRLELARKLGDRSVSVSAKMLALQPRHEAALRGAAERLANARSILTPQRNQRAIEQAELVAEALRTALDELTCLGGKMTPDDIIGRIFATFCIGK